MNVLKAKRFWALLLVVAVIYAMLAVGLYKGRLVPATREKEFTFRTEESEVSSTEISGGEIRTYSYPVTSILANRIHLVFTEVKQETELEVSFTDRHLPYTCTVTLQPGETEKDIPFDQFVDLGQWAYKMEISPSATVVLQTIRNSAAEDFRPDVTFYQGERPQLRTEFWALAALGGVLTLGLCVLPYFCKRRSLVTFLAVFLLGIYYMSIFTPHTIPDEPVHFASAYRISNYMLLQGKNNYDDRYFYMREDDREFFSHYDYRITGSNRDALKKDIRFRAENTDLVPSPQHGSDTKLLTYIPSAMGISLGRLLGLSGFLTYYLGRLFNLLFFAAVMALAVRWMPFGKQMLTVAALLPMSLHLAASYSYDVYHMSMVFLMFAYLMRMMYREEKIDWKQLLCYGVLVVLAVPMKIVYVAVAALVLIVPKDRFRNPKYHLLFKILLGLVAVTAIFVGQLGYIGRMAGSSTTPGNGVAAYTIPWLLSHPKDTILLFANTVYDRTDEYLTCLVGSSLGWFQTRTPNFLALPILLILFLSFLKRDEEPAALRPASRGYSLLMFLAGCFLVLFSLLIDWTPFGSSIIQGVQGRYFIPLLPALYLAVRNERIHLTGIREEHFTIAMVIADGIFTAFQMTLCLML